MSKALDSTGGRADWLQFFRVSTLGIWLGAMIFFSFFFAPAAFNIIPSRHLTGTVITALLSKLNLGALMLVPLWVIAELIRNGFQHTRASIAKYALYILTAASAAISEFWLMPIMVNLRAQMAEQMGSVDNTPIAHPLRVQFNDLHPYSVALLTVDMIAVLIVLFFVVKERRS
jgi:hypothetical protein